MAGYELTPVKTDARGNIDVDDLRGKVDEHTAALMLTNPSTLGLFDENIEEIERIFHGAGALMYYDGANLNAVCGISRPGDMGFDIVHINLHKTFSQPHGGGGPGGGPVAVRDILEPFLPVPAVVRREDGGFGLDFDRPQTIGKVRGFTGPFGVFVRSYAYIRMWGPRLREMSEVAVLNANYVLARLKDAYDLPFDRLCMHEFVVSARSLKKRARLHRARRRQAADGLRLPPADDLLPAHRPRGADGRADGDGGEGDARRVLRRDARDRPRGGGGAGAAEGGAAPPAREAARRGARREAARRQVRLRGALAAGRRAGTGVRRRRRAASDPRRRRELPARRLDVAAACEAHGDGHARALELGRNAAIASRDEPSYMPVGLYGMRLTLKWSRPSSSASARACSGESLTPASITYSTKTRRFVVSACRRHSARTSRERVALVHRHDPRPQLVVRRVEREREADRLVDLVDEALQAGQPADGGDRRAPVRDPEVRQPPRRARAPRRG